jgi:hypothetical protein
VEARFIATALERLADVARGELARFGELWLRLVSWLVSENERVLGSLPAPSALWYVLVLLVAGRALFSPALRAGRRQRRAIGGAG